MGTTNKSKREPHDSKRALCVKEIASELNVSPAYVRMAINSNSDAGQYVEIRRAYVTKYNAVVAALSSSKATA